MHMQYLGFSLINPYS